MVEIQPVNPVDVFLRILLFLGVLSFFGVQSSEMSSPSVSGVQVVPHVIEKVDVVILESYPMQVQLVVTGYQSDGCQELVQTNQHREGNTVFVDIYRELPLDVMCPAVIEPYQETIPLEGTFESGSYTFSVNGFSVETDM